MTGRKSNHLIAQGRDVIPSIQHLLTYLLQAAKAERVSERVVPSVTERFFGTTSRVSQSLPSVVWRVVVVSSVSQLVCFPSIFSPSEASC